MLMILSKSGKKRPGSGRFSRGYRRFVRISQPVQIADLLLSWISLASPVLAYFFGWERLGTAQQQFPELGLPFRIVLMVIAAALLGWGLGYALNVLSKRDNGATRVICLVLSGTWALLLVGAADGLSDQGDASQFLLFTLIGLALMLWLLTFQLRAEARMVSAPVLRDRSAFLLVFTLFTVLGVLLVSVLAA